MRPKAWNCPAIACSRGLAKYIVTRGGIIERNAVEGVGADAVPHEKWWARQSRATVAIRLMAAGSRNLWCPGLKVAVITHCDESDVLFLFLLIILFSRSVRVRGWTRISACRLLRVNSTAGLE